MDELKLIIENIKNQNLDNALEQCQGSKTIKIDI